MSTESAQVYDDDPLAVRRTDQYQQEYIRSFVERWDDLIDWDKRAEGEDRFFIDQLREHGVQRVLDVATGTGFHSVRLLEAGFDVVSVDGSAEMLAKAFQNAWARGLVLRPVTSDWRWLTRQLTGRFDAVVCLGNSFTHLFAERDRRKALAEFYAILEHDGMLVLDQRNYDALLDERYSNRHHYYYCGTEVESHPEHVDEGLARFCYRFPDGSEYHLNMFPLRANYTRSLMRQVGFQRIETFGDFQASYDHEDEPDFLIHVAEKSYQSPHQTTGTRTS